jgi:hypothetical protein
MARDGSPCRLDALIELVAAEEQVEGVPMAASLTGPEHLNLQQ